MLLLPLAALPLVLTGQLAERPVDEARRSTAPNGRLARNFRTATSTSVASEVQVTRLGEELRRWHTGLWTLTSGYLTRVHMRRAALKIIDQSVLCLTYGGTAFLVVRDAVAGRRSVGDVVLGVALVTRVLGQVASLVILLSELQRLSGALRHLEAMRSWVRAEDDGDPRPRHCDRLR
ncbi:MAG: hypothetical protein ACRCZD_19170 [Phycicoccus sp.]